MAINLQNLEKESKTLDRSDVILHYEVWGSKTEQPPVVFLHGWAGSVSDWEPMETYREGSQWLTYDAAGFGRSQFKSAELAKQADFSIERYIEDLWALLEAEGYQQVQLVGHSWGGVIAMSFAARYPERVASLVAIGAAYFDPTKKIHILLKWASYLIAWLLVTSKKWLRRYPRLRRMAVRRYFYRLPDQNAIDRLIEEVLASDNQAVIQTLLAGYKVLFKVICPQITCPTLYLGCERDVVASPIYVKPFVPLTPRSNYVLIPACGHFPMVEQPEQLGQLLQQFWQTAA
jgi:pimeloyl-ACP methyl ester carboxylesterase